MSEYKNHWSSSSENKNQIRKLDEKQTYNIINVEKIKTSFGKKYILIDDNDNRYWTINKIDEFIKDNKEVKQFELITSEFKTFTNKKGEKISYLSVNINY